MGRSSDVAYEASKYGKAKDGSNLRAIASSVVGCSQEDEEMDISEENTNNAQARAAGTRKRTSDEILSHDNLGKRKVSAPATDNNETKDRRRPTAHVENNLNKAKALENNKASLRNERMNKYGNKDQGPFIVYMYANPNDQNKMPHPLAMARVITNLINNDATEIKSIGRGKTLAVVKTATSANVLISSISLKDLNYRAFIPSYLVSRIGVIKDIPTDYNETFLKENLQSVYEVVEVVWINRKINTDGKSEIKPTKSVRIVFEGRALPGYVSLFHTRLQVTLYIPHSNICFNCYRVGHISKACKGTTRCLHCGKGKHTETENCSEESNPPLDALIAEDHTMLRQSPALR